MAGFIDPKADKNRFVNQRIAGASVSDQVSFLIAHLGPLPGGAEEGPRLDKVEAVRAQLDAGTYEDDHKLNVAVDRLLDAVLDGLDGALAGLPG